MAVDHNESLGHVIKKKRLQLGMTLRDLAAKANVSTYTINKLNRNENVNVEVLVKICGALDCPIESIMEVIPD